MTTPLEIPVSVDTPLYSERVTLEGREYFLVFDFNEREAPGRWYLSISDVNGDLLASGVKLVSNWPLLRQYSDTRLPPGTLLALDLSALGGEPADFQALGRRVVFLYYPEKD